MRHFSKGTRLAVLFAAPILSILIFRFFFALPQITFLPFVPPHPVVENRTYRTIGLQISHLPFAPLYLYSFDSVNLALALKDFDPTRNQPQPPGYPFFVAETRLLFPFFGTPERLFAVLALLIGGLSVMMLYLLGKQIFSARTGFIAAALLLVNPVFWFSMLTSALRPHLALISLLVAYFCWRAMSGEGRYFYAASLALGLGSGFRPELLLLLFPLWLWTGWECRNRARDVAGGTVLLGIAALVWVAVLIIASGGLAHLTRTFAGYTFFQFRQTSVLVDPRSGSWVRWAARAILWNGLGVIPWIWTLPFAWSRRSELGNAKRIGTFLAIWFLPAFAFQLAVHINEPDHTLTTVPVLCLAGGFCVMAAVESLDAWPFLPQLKRKGVIAVVIALAGNLLLFAGELPVPQRGEAAGFRGLQSLEDAVLIGTYESSFARVRWVNQMMELAMEQIQDLKTSAHGPILLIWARDGEPVWRKAAYYLPSERIYALEERGDPAAPGVLAQLWCGNQLLKRDLARPPIEVPVPRGGRLIWLIAPAAVDGLRQAVPLQKAEPLYYTDLSADSASFQWGSFRFVPQ